MLLLLSQLHHLPHVSLSPSSLSPRSILRPILFSTTTPFRPTRSPMPFPTLLELSRLSKEESGGGRLHQQASSRAISLRAIQRARIEIQASTPPLSTPPNPISTLPRPFPPVLAQRPSTRSTRSPPSPAASFTRHRRRAAIPRLKPARSTFRTLCRATSRPCFRATGATPTGKACRSRRTRWTTSVEEQMTEGTARWAFSWIRTWGERRGRCSRWEGRIRRRRTCRRG
jgi:hypothetical protein